MCVRVCAVQSQHACACIIMTWSDEIQKKVEDHRVCETDTTRFIYRTRRKRRIIKIGRIIKIIILNSVRLSKVGYFIFIFYVGFELKTYYIITELYIASIIIIVND